MTPRVSVIMAAYNGAAWLPDTLASLYAQTLTDWELVVVDDRSTDATLTLLRACGDARVRVIESVANGGPVVARNRAFAEARGRYIAALDQDDIALPERLAQQVAWLDTAPDTVLVASATDQLVAGRRVPWPAARALSPDLIDWQMLVCNPIVWSSVMFRAEAARRLSPFERPDYRYVEDFDLYHRLRPFGRIAQIDAVLTLYRQHPEGASRRHADVMRANAERLLRERQAALLGAPDAELAALVQRHVMAREAVPDAATLRRLFDGIGRLRAAFLKTRGAAAAAPVEQAVGELWWRVCRASIRAGTLTLRRAVAARRAPVPLAQAPDLVTSQIIGGVRAMRRGLVRPD